MQLDRLALAGSRVPRYTSYPTAAQFDDGVGPADVARWLGELDPREPASLYLHVPFCRRLCLYCGCNTAITARQAPLDRYVEALLREIDLVASRIPGRLAISHLHFGGGTPTILEPGALGAVMDALRARFEVLPRAEVATEIDPRGLDDARIRMLAATGFTRVSLGVQDLDPGVQAAIDRIQPRDLVARAVDRLRAAGLARISMDLIYGLPRQDEGTIARSAEAVAEMGPDRVALFGYAHVPWMKPHQRLLEPAGLPGASQRLALCDAATGVLLASGYDAIGIDHFALPGDELARAAREGTMRRNFQGYTTDAAAALLGLGASAIGSFGQGHAQNATRVDAWGAAIAVGSRPQAGAHHRAPDVPVRGRCRGRPRRGPRARRHPRWARAARGGGSRHPPRRPRHDPGGGAALRARRRGALRRLPARRGDAPRRRRVSGGAPVSFRRPARRRRA